MAQDAAMLLITCTCGQRMKVPAEAMGKTATCVKCGERLTIGPDNAQAPQAAPAPAAAKQAPKGATTGGGISAKDLEILRLLGQNKLVTSEAIKEVEFVMQDLPGKPWNLLIELGHLTSEDFHGVMAKQKGVAGIDLLNYNIPADVKKIVPVEIVRRGIVVPVDQLGKLLTLAMACPLDTDVVEEVVASTGLKVKAMLCKADDLKRTIATEFPLLEPFGAVDDPFAQELQREFGPIIDKSVIAQRIFEIDSLPPSATTSDQLKTAIDGSGNGTTLRAVTDVIATDPLSTALLLRVTNSEAYGFEGRVDGVGLACALVGTKGAWNIINSAGPTDYVHRDGGFDYDSFWHRARFCAEAAQALANTVNQDVAVNAYAAGILHQIGQLALAAVAPKSYPRMATTRSGAQLAADEERIYKITSEEAGYMLARKWNLPHSIAEPIRFQKQTDRAGETKVVTAVVSLAAIMAEAHQRGEEPALDAAEAALNALELTAADVSTIYREMASAHAPA